MNYPETPGYKRGGTSKAAADSMREKAPSLEKSVLTFLKTLGPMTPDECAWCMSKTPFAIRPRFTALSLPNKKTGEPPRIVDTGLTRPNESGRPATVWRAV